MTAAVRATARVEATDLGVHQLRDVHEPMHLYQLATASSRGCVSSMQRGRTCLSVRPG